MAHGVLLLQELMKTPLWLERLRQLPERSKKNILIAFLSISIIVVIIPMVILQGKKNFELTASDPSIDQFKATLSSEFEEFQKQRSEVEQLKPKKEELVFGEDYAPPLKSMLDHNVSFAINAQSNQIGSFLVLDISMLNFGKIPARFDPMAIRVVQNGKETAPLLPNEWSSDIVAMGKAPLGSTLASAEVVSGILVFPTKGPTFDLLVPDLKTEDGTSTWSYTFTGVTLNPPGEKKSPLEDR